MRSTCEIIADVKDGKKVPYEELKMASLVQSCGFLEYKKDVEKFVGGGIVEEISKKIFF